MPIPSSKRIKAAAAKHSPCNHISTWTGAALSKLTTKRTASGSTSTPAAAAEAKPAGTLTDAVATPILNAALLEGNMHAHLRAGEKTSKALTIPRARAVRLWQRLAKYSSSIIRNPRDRFDGCLPDFFVPARVASTEGTWREMTGAELEEAGFAYGEDLEALEMQGMLLMGWVAEKVEEERLEATEATEFV